jgi:hypothetical protein
MTGENFAPGGGSVGRLKWASSLRLQSWLIREAARMRRTARKRGLACGWNTARRNGRESVKLPDS